MSNRKRPRITSSNASSVRQYFGEEVNKSTPIPVWINDYNHFMLGVDLADQIRCYHSKHLKCRRNWLPLFLFILQVSIVNSYILFSKKKNQKNASM